MADDGILRETFSFTIHDASSGVEYRPWTDGYAVGFRAEHADGRVEYLYLNPSGETDDGQPNVFLYQGPYAKPGEDTPAHHYNLFELVAAAEEAEAATLEGTTEWSRSTGRYSDICVCCDGPHVYGYGLVELDPPGPYGPASYLVNASDWLWQQTRRAPEGARVRISFEVLP